MNQMMKLINEILNLSEEFTPIPFWFLNDEPNSRMIESQLQDYVEKGVHGIVIHPRIGIPKEIGYLSEAYFEAVRFIVETAARPGMKIVLYDEGMYPSGSAHGMVVAENPQFAARGITVTEEPEEKEVITRLRDRRDLVKGFTGGTIRGIHFGEDDGEEGAPLAADILNSEAVDALRMNPVPLVEMQGPGGSGQKAWGKKSKRKAGRVRRLVFGRGQCHHGDLPQVGQTAFKREILCTAAPVV